MKQNNLIMTALLIGLTITSCNQTTNQNAKKSSIDSTSKIENIQQDTIILTNKIDIEKFRKSGYQIFEDDNFVIKTRHSFSLDNSFEGDGSTFPYKIYAAYKNKGDFENGIIFKIKIDNIEADYKNIERKDYPENTKSFMDNYKKNLTEYNIDYNLSKVDNEESIIYKMEQTDPNSGTSVKTTSAFFVHERKSYLVQITSSKDQEETLKKILENLKFIK